MCGGGSVCVCLCMYSGDGGDSVFECFLQLLSPLFFEKGLSPRLEFRDSARLASHKL